MKEGRVVGAVPPGRRQSFLPRIVHYLWATWLGYFWLPCPRCGEEFGGHEWDGTVLIIAKGDSFERGRGVCCACSREVKADPALDGEEWRVA